MTARQTLNQLWSRALVEEFVRGGVTDAVICPGSRSTPLALACAEQAGIRCWSVVDERSAGFFALGMAKFSGVPPLLIATSGTAGAHFYPAAIEAAITHVPMVVLTADRPWELQGFGAAQTIPQQQLFGAFARLFLDLGEPEALDVSIRHLRANVHRALHVALHAPRGLVHLNAPFREPLVPPAPDAAIAPLPVFSSLAEQGRPNASFTVQMPTDLAPHPDALAQLRQQISKARKGLIIVGPREASDGLGPALARLSSAVGYPLLAEASSQVRFGQSDSVVAHYDAMFRSPTFEESHRPELILRFGGGITCKSLQAFIDTSAKQGTEVVVFSDRGAIYDPGHAASAVVHGNAVVAAESLLPKASLAKKSEFAQDFEAAEKRVRKELIRADGEALTEPAVARALVSALPQDGQLFLASSMPIRDVDSFSTSPHALRVFSNRGANGIDGSLSTALGISAASGRPTVALVGDLAFLHDLGALFTAHRTGASLCVVVVNNGGGGIFSFLPVAQQTAQFESLFATAHQLRFQGLGNPFGFRYAAPKSASELKDEVRRSLEGGPHLIEVEVPPRTDNVQVHRDLFEKLVSAVESRE